MEISNFCVNGFFHFCAEHSGADRILEPPEAASGCAALAHWRRVALARLLFPGRVLLSTSLRVAPVPPLPRPRTLGLGG